ncbi:MAG TPA: hypothetical protein VLF66_14885 [Thermoanaerobaculia bacterium]|nr:hypothetical protein [Thermoanaerobaculia bacterium]
MATAAEPPSPRRGAVLQIEDLALFGLLALAEPLLDGWLGEALAFGESATADGTAEAVRAVLLVIAAGGTAACILTRPRGRPVKTPGEALGGLEGWARFPLMVLLAVILDAALEPFGGDLGEGCFFGVVLLLSAPLAFYPRLPELAVPLRRLLMTPAILLGAGAFQFFSGGLLSDGEVLSALPARDDPTFGYAALLLGLLIAGTAAFYMLLVVAPRVVAGASGSRLLWLLRFALFVAGLAIGVSVPP